MVAAWGVFRLCAGLLLLIAVLPVGVSAQPAPPRDLKTIVDSKVLRVGLTRFDLPAFHRRSGGSFSGPEIDLARQVGAALGVDVKFIDDAASFDGVVNAVANGSVDIGLSKLSQTYYRLERVRFSTPYISLRHALLFNRASVAEISGGQAPDETLRTFNGRIGVIGRSAYVDFARRNFPRAQILERTNWDNAVAGLLDRSLDAIYRDEFEIKRLLKIRPALNVQFGAAVITDQHAYLSVAICDSCSKLQEFINYHLTQVQGIFTLPRLLASDLSD